MRTAVLHGPTALNELNYNDYQRYDEEEMEEAIERIGCEHPQEP